MGSFKRSRLTDAEIVRRYLGGECVGMVALRARMPVYWINGRLDAAGVRLRGPSERLRLAAAQRKAREAA